MPSILRYPLEGLAAGCEEAFRVRANREETELSISGAAPRFRPYPVDIGEFLAAFRKFLR